MIPQSFIAELLARTDIVEIVGRHVTLKRSGVNYQGLCPFHGEKTPSFTVSPSKQFYHCFGCGAHGSAIGFLMAHAGLGYVEAIHDLAQRLGMTVPESRPDSQQRQAAAQDGERRARLIQTLERANRHYREGLKNSQRAIAYLKRRGLSGQIAAEYGLGYAADDWRGLAQAFDDYGAAELAESGLVVVKGSTNDDEPPAHPALADGDDRAGVAPEAGQAAVRRYDRLRDRITFPIRNIKGELIGFGGRVIDQGEPKYLNSPETLLFHKGEELYGLYEARLAIRERKQVLVVEGYMDVVALAQFGFRHVVATLGTACTPMQVQKLFRHGDTLIFGFDGDAAGQRAARRALQAALPHAGDGRVVKFLFLPAEHDPDSFVREQGLEAFERLVAGALPLSRFMLQVITEGCNLQTAEGRAQAVVRAKPLLQSLPSGSAMAVQMQDDVARTLQTSTSDLRQLLQGGAARLHAAPSVAAAGGTGRRSTPWSASGAFAPRANLPPPRSKAFTPAERAIINLLACPQAWQALPEEQRGWLLDAEGPAGAVARWLSEHEQAQSIMHAVVDDGAWQRLGLPAEAGRLRAQALLEIDRTEVNEVLAALAPLEAQRIKQRCEELVQAGLVDEADRQAFRRLQARLRQLAPPSIAAGSMAMAASPAPSEQSH